MAGRSLHVTTALGLQAVLATGIAMGLAWIVGVEHPSWVFWTSFVVIAGSVDESLRRIFHRVIGTVVGVLVGVAFAVLLPAALVWVVATASLAIVLAIYFAPLSHAWFVLWLNAAFVLLYAPPGGDLVDLLVERPLMTVVGAAVAAIVVVRVLPIRRSGRYLQAVLDLMASIRNAIDTWTAAPVTEEQAVQPLPGIEQAFEVADALAGARDVETLFGSGNQAARRIDTEVAALAIATARLGSAVGLDPEAAAEPVAVAVGRRISHNLEATSSLLEGRAATVEATLRDVLVPGDRPGDPDGAGGTPRPTRTGRPAWTTGGPVLTALVDVHGCVVRLASTVQDRRSRQP
jgi:hypothetical protein